MTAPLLALARSQDEEAQPSLWQVVLGALPKIPVEVLALSPSPGSLGPLLRDAGHQPTEVATTENLAETLRGLYPAGDDPAPFQAILWVEGWMPETALGMTLPLLISLLAEGGTFIHLGTLTQGNDETPSSLAALIANLGQQGVALSPPKDLSEQARSLAVGLLGKPPKDVPAEPPWQRRLQALVSEDASYLLLKGKKTAYAMRAHQPGDESAIGDLFERSFHHRRDVEHWRWQYLDNPWGGPHVSVALDGEGELVAHYAGYPMRFLEARDGGASEVLETHQIGDTMTAPRVRHVGRGHTSLLSRTAAHFFACFSTGRVAFNYGFNEGNIRRFSQRFLGARYVEPVPFKRLELAADTGPLRPTPWWRRLALGETVSRWREPDADCDPLLHRVLPAYRLLAQRDAAYLQWRYFQRPGFSYWVFGARRLGKLRAWAVFRREGETLLLGDLLVDPNHVSLLEPILAEALACPVGEGAKSIEGWFPQEPSFLARELARLGFEPRPQPQDLALMCLSAQHAHPEELLREKLFYTLGDSDLF